MRGDCAVATKRAVERFYSTSGFQYFGCGNPTGLVEFLPGETVLDIGSGCGFDSQIALRKVGRFGEVVEIDISCVMLKNAKKSAASLGTSLHFCVADAVSLPLKDESIDVCISNCVFNLIPQKDRLFRQVYRALKSNGRLCTTDIISDQHFPPTLVGNQSLFLACIGGANDEQQYLEKIRAAGFQEIRIKSRRAFRYDETDRERLMRFLGPDAETVRALIGMGESLAVIGVVACKA